MTESGKEKLIIDGNAVYEIDLECRSRLRKKSEKERKNDRQEKRQGN